MDREIRECAVLLTVHSADESDELGGVVLVEEHREHM
jgi:hypothetical protein